MTQNIPNISELESRTDITVAAGNIDAMTREQLSRAYFQMYYGLSWQNWTRPDMTLGRAWQTALRQINDVMSKYPADNPASGYLARVNSEHQRTWPKTIMTNPRRDGKLATNQTQMAELIKHADAQIASAQATIAMAIARTNVHNKTNAQQQIKQQTPTKSSVAAKKPDVQKPVRNANNFAPADATPTRTARAMPNALPAGPTKFAQKPLNTNPVAQSQPVAKIKTPSRPAPRPIVRQDANRGNKFTAAQMRLIQMQQLQIIMAAQRQHAA